MPTFAIFSLTIWTAVLVAAGISRAFSQQQRTKRRLSKTARTSMRDAVEGRIVKLVGRVRPLGPPQRGPLSGKPCVYYRVTVVHQRGRDSSTLVHEEWGHDFLLEDDSGRALVRVEGARVAVVMDGQWESGTLSDATADQKALLARHGRSNRGVVFNKWLRYAEGLLEAGERVAVLGRVRWEPDPELGRTDRDVYREMPRRIVIEPSEAQPVLVSDDPSAVG